MAGGDAGVGASVWATVGQHRHAALFLGDVPQTQRAGGLKETVVEKARVQRPRRAWRSARPYRRSRAAARELAENTRGSGTGRLHATLKVFVMLNDIVELPDRVLARDLRAEARSGLTGVTFEGGDGRMLVLDFARDRAKRP